MSHIASLRGAAKRLWWWLRQTTGDAAYENYLRAANRGRGEKRASPPLSPSEFYLDSLRRRYSRVSRCC